MHYVHRIPLDRLTHNLSKLKRLNNNFQSKTRSN